MSTKELYRRFVQLCERWPKDLTKSGRDYGEKMRVQLSEHFPHGELGIVKEPKKLAQTLDALERLANNNYYNENPLKRTTASGLDISALRESISNQGIAALMEQEENSITKRLSTLLNPRFSSDKVNPSAPGSPNERIESGEKKY